MIAIAAVDSNWGIGHKNRLLVKIPADMRRFQELTTGNIVIMGRNTFESIGSRPLPDRTNIVISKTMTPREDVVLLRTPEEAVQYASVFEEDEVFVIGGGRIYSALMPYCQKAYITKIYEQYKADTYFSNLDHNSEWQKESGGVIQVWNGIRFEFVDYVRTNIIGR